MDWARRRRDTVHVYKKDYKLIVEFIIILTLESFFVHLLYAYTLQIDSVFSEAEKFFSLPRDTKCAYVRSAESNNNGYVSLQQERYYVHVPPI